MARMTVDEFRRRLLNLSNSRGTVMERATAKAALHIKQHVGSEANARVHRTPRPKGWWVKYDIVNTGERVHGTVRLYGGFAHLAELGSYKKPGGYTIRARTRTVAALERRRGWIGPFHHAYIPPQSFWDTGVRRAAPGVQSAYYDAVASEVKKQFG